MPDPNLEDDVSSGISAMVTGGGSPVDKCKRAVKQWYDQQAIYKSSGGCGSEDGVEAARGFSQLVWKSAEDIFIVVAGNAVKARFFPPGNLPGDFAEDVQC
ncbi:uncharacterized protein LOC110241849 [Exaiptasia diaphana]|uniref:SCP domain-containing protein n=1 Tax=Exaiptasia diaphana TaxID=2652724 RepID=A0A913XF26_EXADI|nr:uncharacterized protein LOC110241849 [Exaiptasia diaphana]KXJ04906.1 hypothetical protein AC249_AIPGENE8585 [Exaiptasia diaphana]